MVRWSIILLTLFLLAGCKRESGIVGKWHVVGGHPEAVGEFFADGKAVVTGLLASHPEEHGRLPEPQDWKLEGDRLLMPEFSGDKMSLTVKFPDDNHMDMKFQDRTEVTVLRLERISKTLQIEPKRE